MFLTIMTVTSPRQTHEKAADARPDFGHVREWIFDLDNTLYAADCGVFAQIDARMTAYVARFLNRKPDEARAIQKDLYRQYGTTLNGLIQVHGADPEAYLAYVHDIDLSGLSADGALKFAITRLPGRRYIFTNGCRRHAARILHRLEMTDLFDDVWDIRTSQFVPKPDALAYDRVIAHAGVTPERAAMFDDIARNLTPAHARGMTTVWLKSQSEWSKQGPDFPVASAVHIDHETSDLTSFLNTIRI